jgi:putative tricarboxylic transport membrane protein
MSEPSLPTDATPAPPADDQPLGFWARWGELFVAAGVLALGIVILVGAQDIRLRSGVVVSPRIFPQIVGTVLVVLSIWYALDIVRAPNLGGAGEDDEDVDPNAPTNWMVIGILAVALVAYAVLMRPAGFIIASTILFTISTWAMGSRAWARNAVIGLVLAVGVYLLFSRWLGVRLPAGWLEGLG